MSINYSLLFLDLDGTIVSKGDQVSPRTIDALNCAAAQGCTPVICTGRTRHMVETIAAQWSGHGYAILSNGAVIAEWESGRVVRKITVSTLTVQRAARIAHALEASPLCFGVHAEEDDGKSVYVDNCFPIADTYFYRNKHRLVFCENLETIQVLEPVNMGTYGPFEQIEQIAQGWKQSLAPGISTFFSFDAKYDCWCAFLNASCADKALVAQYLSRMLGVPEECTMAIGDHLNDIELLKWAGLGICMGNGHAEAQACARHVTGTFAEDGAAQAIERFILQSEIP